MANKTPAMILHELSIKLTRSTPVFSPVSIIHGVYENEFLCRVEVLGIDTTAKGRSKKLAKQEAARKALNILKKNGVYKSNEAINSEEGEDDSSELDNVINYKGELMDICSKYNIPAPEFTEISAVGPPHDREFTYECLMGNSIKTRAKGSTKRMARQIVAKEMVEKIKDIAPDIAKEFQNERLKLNDVDQKANEVYNKVTKLGKNIGISTYNERLREIMMSKQINVEDLKDYFELPYTEEKLACLLSKFDLKHVIVNITGELDKYQTVIVEVNLDCPLTSIGQSTDVATATKNAIDSLFGILKNLTDL